MIHASLVRVLIMLRTESFKGLDFTWQEVNEAIQKNRLLSFDLELSRRCNLRCVYCYAESGRRLANEMTLDEIKNVIDQGIDLGTERIVVIGGGETLLHKHYFDVIDYIKSKNLPCVSFTNGTLITKDLAKKLYDNNIDLAVKFNSFDEDIQDFLAGSITGTGRRIKQAINYLLGVGYCTKDGPKLACETVICKYNYDEIEKIYKWCRERDILPYVEILTVQGNATKHPLAISISESFELFKKLLNYDKQEFNYDWPLTPPIVGQNCKRIFYSA